MPISALDITDWVNKIISSDFVKDVAMYTFSGFMLGFFWYVSTNTITDGTTLMTFIKAGLTVGLYQAAKYVFVYLLEKMPRPQGVPAPTTAKVTGAALKTAAPKTLAHRMI